MSLYNSNNDVLNDILSYKYVDKTIYTFGDSITWGTEGGYAQYIENILKCNLTNKGSSGAATDRLTNIMTGIKTRYDGNFTAPDYSKIDAITIMIGTNGGVAESTLADIPKVSGNTIKTIESGGSITHNGVEIATIEDYWALFPNTYYGNLSLCIEYVQWKNPNCKIYLVTPLATHQHGLTFENNGIRKVKEAMREIGEYYGVTIIDAQANCGINWHNIYEYTTDGTHLNAEGNRKLGTYIAQQMICN